MQYRNDELTQHVWSPGHLQAIPPEPEKGTKKITIISTTVYICLNHSHTRRYQQYQEYSTVSCEMSVDTRQLSLYCCLHLPAAQVSN
jgi:hypothetical protein